MPRLTIALFFQLVFMSYSIAQAVVLNEDFNNYQATTQTMPLGWNFSYQGIYTTSTFSGASGPNSYKFGGAKTTTITPPAFQKGADSLKFWIKGSGTDSISKLIILESSDNIKWDTLAKICPLPTTAAKGKRSFPVKSGSAHLQLSYIKSAGNLAFDDFVLIKNKPTGIVADFLKIIFQVFPNPVVDGTFSICLDNPHDGATITISDYLGKLVKRVSSTKLLEVINMEDAAAGIYFVKIQQGDISGFQKIYVEH